MFLGSAHVEEVCHRLDEAGYRESADAIRNRPPAGALLTHEQKVDLLNVTRDWIGEVGEEELGDAVRLREALEVDLDGGGTGA